MFLGQLNQLDKEILFNHCGGRVMRKIDHDHLGLWHQMLAGVGHIPEELFRIPHVEGDHVSGRQHHGINMDGK